CPKGCTVGILQAGGGAARSLGRDRLTMFATADFALLSSPSLDGIESLALRLGIGPWGGVRLRLSERLVALTTAEWLWLPDQKPLAAWSVEGILRWQIVQALALSAEARELPAGFESQLSLLVYY